MQGDSHRREKTPDKKVNSDSGIEIDRLFPSFNMWYCRKVKHSEAAENPERGKSN